MYNSARRRRSIGGANHSAEINPQKSLPQPLPRFTVPLAYGAQPSLPPSCYPSTPPGPPRADSASRSSRLGVGAQSLPIAITLTRTLHRRLFLLVNGWCGSHASRQFSTTLKKWDGKKGGFYVFPNDQLYVPIADHQPMTGSSAESAQPIERAQTGAGGYFLENAGVGVTAAPLGRRVPEAGR